MVSRAESGFDRPIAIGGNELKTQSATTCGIFTLWPCIVGNIVLPRILHCGKDCIVKDIG